MQAGAITGYIDVAQLTLYAFWLFFAGLIFYLRREDKREGYPLDSDRSTQVRVQGFPHLPRPKRFHLPHGGDRFAPHAEPRRELKAVPVARWPGAPLQPTGRPMVDGIGPASWALRADEPELTFDDSIPKIVPLRVANDHYIAEEDVDPRGMQVFGVDGALAGTVRDIWIDRSEVVLRFLEVELANGVGPRRVLVPMNLLQFDYRRNQVTVNSLTAAQFADIPRPAHPDQITALEEDKVLGYFGGGKLYATPERLGPVL